MSYLYLGTLFAFLIYIRRSSFKIKKCKKIAKTVDRHSPQWHNIPSSRPRGYIMFIPGNLSPSELLKFADNIPADRLVQEVENLMNVVAELEEQLRCIRRDMNLAEEREEKLIEALKGIQQLESNHAINRKPVAIFAKIKKIVNEMGIEM
jgi:hypothetical protein